jgi:hypothetical protein
MNLKKLERYLRVNLLGPGPRLMKKEFTAPRSHKFEKHCLRPRGQWDWQVERYSVKLGGSCDNCWASNA